MEGAEPQEEPATEAAPNTPVEPEDAAAGTPAPAASAVAAAAASPEHLISVLKSEQPYETANGSFVYRIDLDLPPFHGIEPKLKLVYSSSRKLSARRREPGLARLRLEARRPASHRARHGAARRAALFERRHLSVERRGAPRLQPNEHEPELPTGGNYFSKVESYRRFLQASRQHLDDHRPRRHALHRCRRSARSCRARAASPPEHRTQYRWLLVDASSTRTGTW